MNSHARILHHGLFIDNNDDDDNNNKCHLCVFVRIVICIECKHFTQHTKNAQRIWSGNRCCFVLFSAAVFRFIERISSCDFSSLFFCIAIYNVYLWINHNMNVNVHMFNSLRFVRSVCVMYLFERFESSQTCVCINSTNKSTGRHTDKVHAVVCRVFGENFEWQTVQVRFQSKYPEYESKRLCINFKNGGRTINYMWYLNLQLGKKCSAREILVLFVTFSMNFLIICLFICMLFNGTSHSEWEWVEEKSRVLRWGRLYSYLKWYLQK